jgi:F-type H+-transporting ATPase subunit b
MEDFHMNRSAFYRKLKTPLCLAPVVLSLSIAGSAFGAEGGGGLTVIPDGSLFIQLANFLLLIWVLNLIVYRPIRNVLIQRKEKISGLEQSIETSQRDVTEKEEAYASGIREARTKGLKEKEELINQASEEEKAIIAKINEKAQADLAQIREKVAQDADDARKSLMKDVDNLAEIIGQKILGRAL